MKFSVVFIFLGLNLLAHADTAACNGNLEAQFIGQYSNVDYSYAEAGNNEHMLFNLTNFQDYQPNGTCPLDIDQAATAQIYVDHIDMNVKDGSKVSGVLVYNPKFNMYWIE